MSVTDGAPSGDAGPAARRSRRVPPRLLLALYAASAFMTTLDVFIVNVGLPELARDVGRPSLGDLSWVLNAYTIMFAALLVPAGRIGDRYGNKGTYPQASGCSPPPASAARSATTCG